MTLIELFASNLDWNTETELTLFFVDVDSVYFWSGTAIDLVFKYGNSKVISFSKHTVSVRA